MLLSIGMIVKNEEKFLDKCLSALKPLLEAVDSELIIADTGSVDNTVEIAKKYTDNVFYFEWINDFAAARNSTLERASGEWFMFVDADEIFKDCDDIIRFFNSGEHKRFESATYVQRNYISAPENERTTFSDFNAPRLCRVTPETKFHHAIHEGFTNFRTPVKILHSIVDHYGYIHDDDEQTAKKKTARNRPLLLKRLEEEEPRSLLYMQLFESFYEEDEEKGLEYLDKGLELSIKEKSCNIPSFYHRKAGIEYDNKRYEKAIEYLDAYLNLDDKEVKPVVTGSDAEFRVFKAHVLHCLGRAAEAAAEFIKFFRLYRDFSVGKLDTPDVVMYEFSYCTRDKFHLIHMEFLMCCIQAKKFNTAIEYLKLMPIKDCPDDAYIRDRIRNEIIIAENCGFKNLKALYVQLEGNNRYYFERYVRARVFLYGDKAEYARKLAEIAGNGDFGGIVDIIRGYLSGDGDISERVTEFAASHNAVEYPELLYVLIAANKDIRSLSECSTFEADKMTFSCCGDYEGFYTALAGYDINVCSEEALPVLAATIRSAIIKAESEKEPAEELLTAYGRTGLRINADPADESLSPDVKGAVIAGGIVGCMDNRDFKGCIAYMKMLLGVFPDFKIVISAYQQVIKDAAGIGNRDSMATMAVVVKRNIRIMIKNGDTESAGSALGELAQLTPNDPEIADLADMIEEAKGLTSYNKSFK